MSNRVTCSRYCLPATHVASSSGNRGRPCSGRQAWLLRLRVATELPAAGTAGKWDQQHDRLVGSGQVEHDVAAGVEPAIADRGLPERDSGLIGKGSRQRAATVVMAARTLFSNTGAAAWVLGQSLSVLTRLFSAWLPIMPVPTRRRFRETRRPTRSRAGGASSGGERPRRRGGRRQGGCQPLPIGRQPRPRGRGRAHAWIPAERALPVPRPRRGRPESRRRELRMLRMRGGSFHDLAWPQGEIRRPGRWRIRGKSPPSTRVVIRP